MKKLLTLALLAIASLTIDLPAADTLKINPEATAALLEWEHLTADQPVTKGGPGRLPWVTNAPAPPAAEAPAVVGKFYADTFMSLRTTDFSHDETFSYGAGVGCVFTPVFSGDVRVTHAGLNLENNAVSTVGARVSARLPWQFLSPSIFFGAAFDLGPDEFRIQPGLAAEIGMSKVLRGMSLIVEGGLDSNLRGQSGFLFTSVLRWRF